MLTLMIPVIFSDLEVGVAVHKCDFVFESHEIWLQTLKVFLENEASLEVATEILPRHRPQ